MAMKNPKDRRYGPTMDDLMGAGPMPRERARVPDFSTGNTGRGGIGGSGISVGGVGTGVAGPVPGDRVMGRGMGVRASMPFAKGGKVKAKPKKMAKGGSTASKRADGCATKGKTKGRFV